VAAPQFNQPKLGDIQWVYFPYPNDKEGKTRPTLCIKILKKLVLSMMISTSFSKSDSNYDPNLLLIPDSENGLESESIIVPNIIKLIHVSKFQDFEEKYIPSEQYKYVLSHKAFLNELTKISLPQ